MNPRIINQAYEQRTNYVKKTITYAPPVILPTKYITETHSNYPYPTNQYSTSTQPKQVTNPPYQAYTAPVYNNYPQNNNVNYTYKYSGETERQTYQNNQNVKLAQNYGIIDQNNLQNIQMHKRPSAGLAQNYKNINTNNINMNQIPKVNNIQYKEMKVNYVQPQQNKNNIINANNYYQNNNINNNIYNNYNYTEKNTRKYNYEFNDNSMYIVQIGTTKTNPPQRIIYQQNIPQNNQQQILNQQYLHNQNIKQNVKNNNINNNIYNDVNKYFYTNPPPPQQQQIYPNQTKNIIPNTNIPTSTHHHNNSAYNANHVLINNQVNSNLNNMNQIHNQVKTNMNNINQINNQVKANINNVNNINQIKNQANANINTINNIPKQNQIIQQTQQNQQAQFYNQILNSAGYPQQKVAQPQLQQNIPNPVVKTNRHSNMEEPPDNMRNRGKHQNQTQTQNNEYFNNTMPNLKTYNDILSGYNNIFPNETTNTNEKNNYYENPNFQMTFDKRNKIAKVNMSNVPQKINELSFPKTNKSKPIQTNQNIINKNVVNNINNNNNANYQKQNNAQIQKNNNIINYNILSENVEYRDQYGNILVYINGQFIDKRLLVNSGSNHNKSINNNNKQINNQNITTKDINIAQNNNINQENSQFTNTYPLPGQKTYSTQTLINNAIEQNANINMNINMNNNIYQNQNQNQNYSQRSNRFLEDQNFTNANINNYNINLNVNQQNDLINDINNLFKNPKNPQVNQPEILTVEPQKPKRRRPVFKIPPSKKRSISQGRSLNFIHKYYDENFILEEENEDNASDSENKKTKKSFKKAVKEVINIKKLVPNQQQDEEKKQNNEINHNTNINKEEMPSIEINKENKDTENNDNENNNNVMRLSHMGFSLERSSFLPENDINKNDNDNDNEENNINNNKYNFDDLNIDKNIYEEKKIDLNENTNKIRRNIDINMDEDNDDNINIDKINEKLNEKLKLYTEREKEKQKLENNQEKIINNQKLSGEISKPNIYNISEENKNIKNLKSDEIKKGPISSTNKEQHSKLDNPSYINNENIMANNSSISQNLLRDSDISVINPKFYEPMKDSIRNLQINDFDNNGNNKGDERINMNIEEHDLDKYFKKENEKKEIKKKEIDSSLRTINSEGEIRNSQQIVDNLDEEEENNNIIINNNLQKKKSGDTNTNNEKLKTINDIITSNDITSEKSKKIINNNNKK